MASILAAAGIPTAVRGVLVWQLKRRIERQEARQEAAEKAREEFETNLYESSLAAIALGEATHRNAEFQRLKLEVFTQLEERNGVRAFALEGDCGGCEQVNRYIHGGSGTAQEATVAIGFAIYRSDEMAELISYMRRYNDNAPEGEALRYYGFEMQRLAYRMRY